MNGRGTLLRVTGLALISIAGMIGMLLVTSAWLDLALLTLSALPLAYGLWRWNRQREARHDER